MFIKNMKKNEKTSCFILIIFLTLFSLEIKSTDFIEKDYISHGLEVNIQPHDDVEKEYDLLGPLLNFSCSDFSELSIELDREIINQRLDKKMK